MGVFYVGSGCPKQILCFIYFNVKHRIKPYLCTSSSKVWQVCFGCQIEGLYNYNNGQFKLLYVNLDFLNVYGSHNETITEGD